MLNRSYELITTVPAKLQEAGFAEDDVLAAENAMKEDFCIHARLLLEFFTKKSTGIDSAIVFAPTYKPPELPVDLNRKLNNQIAHIIYTRKQPEADMIDGKDRNTLLAWIDTELRAFKAALPAPYDKTKIRDVDLSLTKVIQAGSAFSATNHTQAVSTSFNPTPPAAGGTLVYGTGTGKLNPMGPTGATSSSPPKQS